MAYTNTNTNTKGNLMFVVKNKPLSLLPKTVLSKPVLPKAVSFLHKPVLHKPVLPKPVSLSLKPVLPPIARKKFTMTLLRSKGGGCQACK